MPEVCQAELPPPPLGQGQQVLQLLEQQVHPGEGALIQEHPQTLAATETCGQEVREVIEVRGDQGEGNLKQGCS